jgi:hypothetical protein
MLIVMIEHIIMACKYFLAAMINDKPTWVLTEEREKPAIQDEVRVLMEMKREKAK